MLQTVKLLPSNTVDLKYNFPYWCI